MPERFAWWPFSHWYYLHQQENKLFTECVMNTEMILKLDKLQPRKDKPAVLGSITLLDIVANGTAIRLFKETVVVFGETSRKRIVMNVRRHSGKGWVAKQVIWPESDLELALLEVNKVAQQEIQRATTLAIA
jgi:hypothetical protein